MLPLLFGLNIKWLARSGHLTVMIVCSCNILSDQDVRAIARDPSYVPPRVAEIYSRLGCNAECGRCARTIRTIIDEATTAQESVPG